MRILYVITLADGGGAQQYTLQLAKHFKGSIAAGTEEQQLFTDARAAGLPTFGVRHLKRDIRPWHDLLAVFELRRLIRELKPDIVHLNSTKAGLLGSIAGRLAGTKVVFTAHGFRYLEPLSPAAKRFYLFIEKFASLFRDRIIAVSQADYNSALAHGVISPRRIRVIYNGIAPINFLSRSQARKQLGLPDDKFIFGTVANFYPAKGLDVLIDAVNLLPAELREKTIFTVIGHGPAEQNLKSKIENLKLSGCIKLPGQIPESKRLLKAFDCYILPSRKEGLAFALIEALQAELPIIATKVGGNPEVLGQAGLPVKAQDPRALAAAMQKLLTDDALRKTFGEQAGTRSALFTQERMFKETCQVYEELLKPRA